MENNYTSSSSLREFENDYTPADQNFENNTSASYENITVQKAPKLKLILEPAVFLIYFAIYLVSPLLQKLLLYQSCRTIFHYNADDCEPLLGIAETTNASEQIVIIVRPYAAQITLTLAIIESVLPAVITLFAGPWSDRFGRRDIMMITFAGYFIYFVIMTILSGAAIFYKFSPWLYVMPSILLALTGGKCAMLTVFYCYITDVAHENLKGLCLMLNNSALGIGTLVGYLISTPLFGATNAALVTSLAAVLVVLAFLYVVFFVKEGIPATEATLALKLSEFFHYELLVDLVRTCFLKRAILERVYIWLIILPLVITNFVTEATNNIFYSFLSTQFHSTTAEYSTYFMISSGIIAILSTPGMIILRRVCKCSIDMLALLSLISYLGKCIITVAAAKFWQLYLAAGCGFLSGIVGPMMLAMLSRMIPPAEIGKIFAVSTALQTLTLLGATPLYTTIYDATLNYFPGMVIIVSIVLYLLCIMSIVNVYIMRRKNCIKMA